MKYFKDKSLTTCAGSPVRVQYAPIVNVDGSVSLVESGKENVQDYIQSHLESTDIHKIVARIQAGEIGLLKQRTGSFGDFSKVPTSMQEFLQLQIDSVELFKSLPADIKEQFNGNPTEFLAQSGNKEWYEKLRPVLPDEIVDSIFPKPIDPVLKEEIDK